MRCILILGICSVLLSSDGCVKDQDTVNEPAKIDWERYNESDISSFLLKLKQVSIGDSYEKVILILGHPTYAENRARKESPEIIGRRANYFFKIDNPNLSNDKKDVYVTVSFDKYWKLERIHKNNIPEQ